MNRSEDRPRAVVVLMVDGRALPLGRIEQSIRCDVGLVDDLLRLQLAASRLGMTIRFVDVDERLRELFDLAGLEDRLDP